MSRIPKESFFNRLVVVVSQKNLRILNNWIEKVDQLVANQYVISMTKDENDYTLMAKLVTGCVIPSNHLRFQIGLNASQLNILSLLQNPSLLYNRHVKKVIVTLSFLKDGPSIVFHFLIIE